MTEHTSENDVFRQCPACGHDWSGHVDPPLPFMTCSGKLGLGSVSGCRCTMTLRRVVTAALIETGRHNVDTIAPALARAAERITEYDARLTSPPGKDT